MRLREIKPGMVIHCKTEEEAKILLAHLKNKGIRWAGNTSMDKTIWKNYLHNTCYEIDHGETLRYSDKKHFEMVDREITEFSDLIIPELSGEEVLQIVKEICGNRGCCDMCLLNDGNGCLMRKTAFDPKKVLEVCEQWKADHDKKEPEKKEPEVERVDICRIIQVHDGGKKECVHEIELYESIKEVQAEEAYKAFISTHEGNYIAVVEHVCRVKR